MDGRDIGNAMDGIVKLAMVGLVAIFTVVPCLIIGVILGIIWLFNHVSIH